MKKHKHWTDEETQFLIDNYETMPDRDIAEELNRDVSSVRNRRMKLGIPAKKPIYEVLKGNEILATGTADECAEKLGLKPNTIKCYATASQLKRIKNLDKGTIALRIN